MKTKVLTGFFIFLGIVIMVASKFATNYIFDACFIAISAMAAYEIAVCLNRKEKKASRIASLIYPLLSYICLLVPFLLECSWWWILFFQLWLLIAASLVLFIISCCQKQNKISAGWTIFTFIYPSYLLFFFYLVNHAGVFFNTAVDLGLFGIILTLAISTITDSAAMYTGMLLKGPKIWKKASPNKTISGCCGGLIFGAVASICVFFIFNAFNPWHILFVNRGIEWWNFIIVGLIGSFLTQFGDLLESFFKRKVGVKDTGNFFPAHGGFMDRVDGWCFNIVGIYFALVILFL